MRYLFSLLAAAAALTAAQDLGNRFDDFDTSLEFSDNFEDFDVNPPAVIQPAPAPAPANQGYTSGSGYGSGGGGSYVPPSPPPAPRPPTPPPPPPPAPTPRPPTPPPPPPPAPTPRPPTPPPPPPPAPTPSPVGPCPPPLCPVVDCPKCPIPTVCPAPTACPKPPAPTPCPEPPPPLCPVVDCPKCPIPTVCPAPTACPKPPAPTPCPEVPPPSPAACPAGAVCVDRNECEEGTHNCHELAKCTNTKGSFTCRCAYGTTGDGVTCAGPVTCGTSQCDSRGTDYAYCTEVARDQEGLRQLNNPPVCMCNVGLRGNGANCDGTDVCATVPRSTSFPFTPTLIGALTAGRCFQGSTCTRVGNGNAYYCANPENCPKWQVGRVEVGSQWVTVKFKKVFRSTPVVIAGPPTSRENDAVTVLISKVDSTGFQVKLQEPDNCGDGVHVSELITWLAVLPNEPINVSGNNVYVTAASQIVPMNSDTPVRAVPPLPNTQWAVAQVQDSVDGEITAAFTSYTTTGVAIQVAAAATRRNQAVVGYVTFHGISLANWYLHPTQRYNYFVGSDCDNTPHLFFLGEDLSVPYENQLRPISSYWCIAPKTPWVIAGWSRFNSQPLVLRSFTGAQRLPNVAVPRIPFTNFRIQRFRTSSIVVRAESAQCNSLDDVYTKIDTQTVANNFANAFNYIAILPGYSSCALRGPYVPATAAPSPFSSPSISSGDH